jgi:uncharacterized protein YbjT (DUF2867 family)/nitrite reductase/ring-hydroxylating ferredoxin subunit
MKIVVIGGSGLIGSKVVTKLRADGHEALAASPSSGVDTLTGEGLAEILRGAAVVIDVSNSPSFEDAAVMKFFKTSTHNLLTYEAAAGVGHHVALSVVGTARLLTNAYFRAKFAQEKLIKESSIPYSIVQATQFFEFVKSIADTATHGNAVRVAPVFFQPIAADDVASAVCRVAVGPPLNGTVEIAGPERFQFDVLIRQFLRARNDPREVITDPHAHYFGAELSERSLVPGDGARLGEIRFDDWLGRSPGQIPDASAQPAAVAPPAPRERVALRENEFRISEVPPGSALLVGTLAVFNVGGRFCATQDKCTHRQGPLSEGTLDGSTVTCPYHGAQFDVCTGAVLRGPAKDALKTYRVIVEGEVGRIDAVDVQFSHAGPADQSVS